MATTNNGASSTLLLGSHSSPKLTRTLERVLDDAQLTGELLLSGRKLKEFPKVASKYDLSDTTCADLSKNKFGELPDEVCKYPSLEKLYCYNNVIRTLPDSILFLQCLSSLDLSRNQLTTIPAALCKLPLEVLLLSNNKLVSLPEEIGQLHTLMDLDVSCNEISHLPLQIQDLDSLRSLNMRRNMLQEIPSGISRLHLARLDISGNKISTLPSSIRLIDSLIELILDHNPLTSPPAFLCTRGKVHIFKYLEIQAIKEERKRGMISETYRKSFRKAVQNNEVRYPNGCLGLPEAFNGKQKRYTVDSGYNTSEGGESTRWSQELQDITNTLITNNDNDDPRRLALRAAELTKEQRQERNKYRTNSYSADRNPVFNNNNSHNSVYSDHSGCSTPSTLSPGSDMNLEAEFNRELERQRRLQNEDKMERIRREKQLEHESNERRIVTARVLEQQHETARKKNEMINDNQNIVNDHHNQNGICTPQPHIQTYKEYKESLKQQRSHDIYHRRPSDTCISTSPSPDVTNSRNHSPSYPLNSDDSQMTLDPKVIQQRKENQLIQKRMEDERHKMKQIQKEAVLSFVKQRTSSSESELSPTSPPTSTMLGSNCIPLKPTSSPGKRNEDKLKAPLCKTKNITYNGHHQLPPKNAKEEAECMQKLRSIIELRLKVELPQDLSCALIDGVVLCHLANNVRPRSVLSIHVPSPAVPKLTMAKCKRNIENFLNACKLIGVPEDQLCSAHDILDEKNIKGVTRTVQELFKRGTSSVIHD